MTLQERLEVLQEQYKIMLDYRKLCNGMNCTINYSSKDFDREYELLIKINQTKDWIQEQDFKKIVIEMNDKFQKSKNR